LKPNEGGRMELFVCFAVWVGVLFIVYLMMKQLKGEGNKKNNKKNYEILAVFELEKGKKKYVALVMWRVVSLIGSVSEYIVVIYEKDESKDYALPMLTFEEKEENRENRKELNFWKEIIVLDFSGGNTKEDLLREASCKLLEKGYNIEK